MARRWSVLLLLLFAAPLVAAPTPKVQPPRSLTNREADRQSPPQPWRGNGWRAVFPHAYAMQRRVQVCATPDAAAPAAFEIPGGMRVPIYEQRGVWWRIGGTKARSGWVRAAEMVPHARCVMLDAKTGRVLRQFATKGQWSVLPRHDALWALADTGLTRVAWDGGPHFWSNRIASNANASITREGVWSLDGREVAIVHGDDRNRAELVSLTDGTALGSTSEDAPGVTLSGLDGYPHVFSRSDRDGHVLGLIDPFHHRQIKPAAGEVQAILTNGELLLDVKTGAQAWELQRRTPDGRVVARWKHGDKLFSAVPTPDNREILAIESINDNLDHLRSTVLVTRQLRPVLKLRMPEKIKGDAATAVFRNQGGWLALITGAEAPDDLSLAKWDAHGRFISARGFGQAWTSSANGDQLYLATDRGIERRDLKTGDRQPIPLAWRRPLLKRYLDRVFTGKPHWEISHLNLSPDQKTLIILERLAGDPEG